MIVKRGEVWYADLGEGEGSEQEGVKPIVVIQNDMGNKHSSTVIGVCVTSRLAKKSIPTHMNIQLDKPSIIMAEQVRTLSKSRLKRKVRKLTTNEIVELNKRLRISLSL